MSKLPISVTLSGENLVWLRAQARLQKARSVSELLDRLISQARTGRTSTAPAQASFVGTIRISDEDPGLETADEFVRGLFAKSTRRKARR